MRIVTLMLAAVLTGRAVAALAQQPSPLLTPAPAPDARWSFKRVDDGFVRLDGKTGQVAHCTPVHPGWTCQAVSENRSALEQQIKDLQDQVAALKQQVAALRAAAPSPAPAPPPTPPQEPSVSLRMPTQQDVDRARDYLTGAWHHLVRMIQHFQHDVLRQNS